MEMPITDMRGRAALEATSGTTLERLAGGPVCTDSQVEEAVGVGGGAIAGAATGAGVAAGSNLCIRVCRRSRIAQPWSIKQFL